MATQADVLPTSTSQDRRLRRFLAADKKKNQSSVDASYDASIETKSTASARSNRSARSSVLERARAYNRKIDEQNKQRAKSVERSKREEAIPESPRSQSAGRGLTGNRVSTRERALASVRNESSNSSRLKMSMESPATPSQRYNNNTSSSSPMTTPISAVSNGKHHRSSNGATSSPRVKTEKKTPKPSPAKKDPAGKNANDEAGEDAIVTPELLVDALSGHEDGLLAIAERLMEHYDAGYDVMGESIIDAFADVQKLFQHVVEAAHMEGAAFEASRREQEMAELRKQAGDADGTGGGKDSNLLPVISSPSGPSRHDEFIDQDVKDVLTEAIRKGAPLREKSAHQECYEMYEAACNSASSLLPVDSDHRGRLQLSIARAESMSPDRACAILRYAMDDVLRSGLRAGRAPLPDVSKRSDCVLTKPKDHPSLNGMTASQSGVVQSSEEALASLVEEMKEVLGAPVYDNTPLQSVADRFWAALAEAQRSNQKNAERLEQNLGKLKGEFLLARAEWEEKLTVSRENAENYKQKYMKVKESTKASEYMDQARSAMSGLHMQDDDDSRIGLSLDTLRSGYTGKSSRSSGPGSVASLGSGLAQSARSIVGSFACSGERAGTFTADGSKPYRRSQSAPRSPRRVNDSSVRDDKSFSSSTRTSTRRRQSRSSSQGRLQQEV